jgi:hypothetical protein
MTVTDELLMDTTALTSIASQAFSEEVMFMTEDGDLRRHRRRPAARRHQFPGADLIAKEKGQAAATVVKETSTRCGRPAGAGRARTRSGSTTRTSNRSSLRSTVRSAPAASWCSCRPAASRRRRMRPSRAARSSRSSTAALGTVGDITLVDLSQYMLVDKGGVQMATSMHIAFDTDEMRFRITYRVDGKPMWSKPLTPFKGSTNAFAVRRTRGALNRAQSVHQIPAPETVAGFAIYRGPLFPTVPDGGAAFSRNEPRGCWWSSASSKGPLTMARQFSMPYQIPPVSLLAPAADAAGRTSSYRSLKNALKVYVVAEVNQGNAATVQFSLLQAKDVSGGSSKAMTRRRRSGRSRHRGVGCTGRPGRCASYTTDAAVKNKLVVFEIVPEAVHGRDQRLPFYRDSDRCVERGQHHPRRIVCARFL